jgi:hypothetical protein
MLGKWPFPNKLSEMSAWLTGLWIRRVLVRAQEGQLEARGLLCSRRALPICWSVSYSRPGTARAWTAGAPSSL